MKPSDNPQLPVGTHNMDLFRRYPEPRLRISPIENNIFLPFVIFGDQLLVLRAAVEHEVEDVSGEATAVN